MVKLSFVVFPHLEDERIKFVSDPADGAELFGQVGSLVLVIRAEKSLLGFFKADGPLRIFPQSPAFAWIEVKTHIYNSYTNLDSN
ncbi:MAG: hypothetical protein WAL75_11355 [Terracidiphilus sp.]